MKWLIGMELCECAFICRHSLPIVLGGEASKWNSRSGADLPDPVKKKKRIFSLSGFPLWGVWRVRSCKEGTKVVSLHTDPWCNFPSQDFDNNLIPIHQQAAGSRQVCWGSGYHCCFLFLSMTSRDWTKQVKWGAEAGMDDSALQHLRLLNQLCLACHSGAQSQIHKLLID